MQTGQRCGSKRRGKSESKSPSKFSLEWGSFKTCLLEPLAGRPAASGSQHVAGIIEKLADSNGGIPIIVNLYRLRVSPSSCRKARERRVGCCSERGYDAKTLYYSKFEGGGIWSLPVSGGEEHQLTEALHRGFWGHFAVTEKGIYLLDSDAAPKPTILYYNFQTRLLTPVVQLQENPVPWGANLAASRDGLTLWFAQGTPHNSITMVENFQ